MHEFRHLRCPNCEQKIRIKLLDKDFGKTVIVQCPKCPMKMRVELPASQSRPAKKGLGEDTEELLEYFRKLFGDFPTRY